jgi:hypothetical protein
MADCREKLPQNVRQALPREANSKHKEGKSSTRDGQNMILSRVIICLLQSQLAFHGSVGIFKMNVNGPVLWKGQVVSKVNFHIVSRQCIEHEIRGWHTGNPSSTHVLSHFTLCCKSHGQATSIQATNFLFFVSSQKRQTLDRCFVVVQNIAKPRVIVSKQKDQSVKSDCALVLTDETAPNLWHVYSRPTSIVFFCNIIKERTLTPLQFVDGMPLQRGRL